MALIKLGAMITAISGKVGGQVFVQGAQGSYLKNRGTYTLRPNFSRQKQQVIFSQSVQRWRFLSFAQQQAFKNAAPDFPYTNRFGQSQLLSGFQLFTRCSNYVQSWGSSDIPQTPVPIVNNQTYFQLTNFSFSNFRGFFDELSPNSAVQIVATRPCKTTAARLKAPLELIKAVSPANDFDSIQFWPEYVAKFGEPESGDQMLIDGRAFDRFTGVEYGDISFTPATYFP